MTVEDLERGIAWMQGHFHVIKHVKDDAPTIDWVLEVARLAVMRCAAMPRCVVPCLHMG